MIPKKIFQLLLPDKNNIHPLFVENIDHIKRINTGWNYTLMDDKDIHSYIYHHYPPDILFYYSRINPKYTAARADFFRYLLMWKEGGVYLDIKSSMSIPLDQVIQPVDEYLLSHWKIPWHNETLGNALGEYQQWHIICRPEHPFLKAVIEKVIDNIKNYTIPSSVLSVTGPIAYSQAIIPLRDSQPCREVKHHSELSLIYNNLPVDHQNLFETPHYSLLNEPIIL